jgi:hypothetical protein
MVLRLGGHPSTGGEGGDQLLETADRAATDGGFLPIIHVHGGGSFSFRGFHNLQWAYAPGRCHNHSTGRRQITTGRRGGLGRKHSNGGQESENGQCYATS